MSKIVGYSEKRRNTFSWLAAAIAIISLWVFAWVLFSATHQKPIEPPKKITTTTTTTTIQQTENTIPPIIPSTTLKMGQKKEIKIESHSGIVPVRVVRSAVCRSIANDAPQETASEFKIGEVVYFLTAVEADSVPQTIEHVWINPAGETYFKIDLNVGRPQTSTWSRVTLQAGDSGAWKVRTMSGSKILNEAQFKVSK
jgi:hypothetical protein